ncbi:UNVERIFIED_CONTAM: hypothetical protein Sradi_4887700 [Sesamum radiatum]|uniref:DUF4283 domain-containing protein n=1 Tax=Sesamum radiatum TaxID=300843 RepID=A0AAW2MBZ6_SESRA
MDKILSLENSIPINPPPAKLPDSERRRTFSDVLRSPFTPQIAPTSPRSQEKSFDEVAGLGTAYIYRGRPAISFSDDEKARLAYPYRYALVGKFSHGVPSWKGLHDGMERLGLKGAFSVGVINFRHVLINCSNDEDYARLWMRQIWTFEGMPMRVLKWSPEFSITEESPIAPVWVNLPGLPIHLFDKTALFRIAILLGSPLKIDETTAKRNRPGRARICVEHDLTQKRIMEIWIGKDSRGFAQKVIYENLPKYYLGCRHIGHDLSACYAKNRGGKKHTENSQNDLREILDKKRGKQVAQEQDKQGVTGVHETGTSGVVKQSIQWQTAALDEERRDIDNSTPAEMDNDELQAEQIGVENVTLLDDVNRQITVGDHSATITLNKSGGMQEVVDQSLHRGEVELQMFEKMPQRIEVTSHGPPTNQANTQGENLDVCSNAQICRDSRTESAGQNLMAETEQHLMAENVLLADAENEQHVLDERTESQIQLDDFQEGKSKGTVRQNRSTGDISNSKQNLHSLPPLHIRTRQATKAISESTSSKY